MAKWMSVVPESKGFYFYRPEPVVRPALVERTAVGFLFHGVERFVAPKDMVGEFWSEPIQAPDIS
jgi:hypothetical protein